jgi:deoxyribodipyrimidine photo-lyase
MGKRVDDQRIFDLNEIPPVKGPVVYWMSRDMRINDNWALLHAQDLALALESPLVVVFCLTAPFLGATLRHYTFMTEGLKELGKGLKELNIDFLLLTGKPDAALLRYCRKVKAGALITDFSPLRLSRQWKENIAKSIDFAFIEVDAHNIIPCRIASPKQEYAAYTFRPKAKKMLPRFLTDFPAITTHPNGTADSESGISWEEAINGLTVDSKGSSISNFKPGEKAAYLAMEDFIETRLSRYETERNDPTKDGQSELSPYLHFGQLSAQRLAYMVSQAEAPGVHTESYLEELIIRRELSDNFCFYNSNYDTTECFPRWARETLQEHLDDPREHLYLPDEFEMAQTHDPLWNAAQKQMVITGKMHGYMRMYWAKKILEWTETPAQAVEIAIYLNDSYSLDGRDPNGYAGIAWSIGGVHDRAWFQRPIFGKVRYMSYNGCKSKFDVDGYIAGINKLKD